MDQHWQVKQIFQQTECFLYLGPEVKDTHVYPNLTSSQQLIKFYRHCKFLTFILFSHRPWVCFSSGKKNMPDKSNYLAPTLYN